jgi:hypothetical protein
MLSPVQTGGRDAVPTLTAPPGSFARSVLERRHPAIVDQLLAVQPYGPWQRSRLAALLDDALHGTVTPPPDDAQRWPDAAHWSGWLEPHRGRSEFDVPFLLAESWFHRRLLDAVGFVEPGPWQGVDPFAPLKAAELAALPPLAPGADRDALLLGSLWGNQADLGFRLVADDAAVRHEGLLADESARFWDLLEPGGLALAWVCDNAGRELLADLLLVDRLLADGLAAAVTLHLKPRPHFVSDATARDLTDCLLALDATGAADAAGRLRVAAAAGRLLVAADPFWCAPLELRDAPPGLLDAADVVVFKGDLNYRRLVGDAAWPASTPFADAVQLPHPVVVLRTLKSDVVVGVDAALAARLDVDEPGWRSAGTRALVQVSG